MTNDTDPERGEIVVLRLSRTAMSSYLVVPLAIGFVALLLPFAVPTAAGKVVGLLALAFVDVVVIRWYVQRLARVRATFSGRGIAVCNRVLSGGDVEMLWSEVATIDRRWKYLGKPFGVRGSMLLVSPRSDAPWSPTFVSASYATDRRTCGRVVAWSRGCSRLPPPTVSSCPTGSGRASDLRVRGERE